MKGSSDWNMQGRCAGGICTRQRPSRLNVTTVHPVLLLALLAATGSVATATPRADWSVPLYLWSSDTNRDTALLASPPSAKVGDPQSYSLVYHQPVAFASATYAYGSADVALTAFWSAERQDIQTTDWDLATVNQHGGNYVTLGTVGYLQSQPAGSWKSSIAQAPLLLSYSDGRADAVTAPINAADVNALAAFSKDGGGYRTGEGRVVGFGRVGSCPVCNTTLAAAYPSNGGADCPVACTESTSSFTVIYHVGKWAGAGPDQFRASMLKAGSILQSGKFGPVIATEAGSGLHVSFSYLCCYSPTDKATIRDVLKGIDWPPLNISFGEPVWRIDNPIVPNDPADTSHHYSIIVQLDEPSNARMEAWVAAVEMKIKDKGVLVHLPRIKQQPFHSTLGVVDGLEFATEAALDAINGAIPPHSWTTANLTLGVPDF